MSAYTTALSLSVICISNRYHRQALSQVLKFGETKYIFRGARFLF